MPRVNRVLCLEDGLEVCIAGSDQRWQIASYSVRLFSLEAGESNCLIPVSAPLGKKRFPTIDALVTALRRDIELHGEPVSLARRADASHGARWKAG
jgi:hypothetical protein